MLAWLRRLIVSVGIGGIANVTAALRWRISPRWSQCLDFLAQMNLVLDILRMPFGDTI
jgi:hypothetical protein